MDKMKTKDYHIKISDENLILLKKLAIKDRIRLSQVFERAIEFYLRARRMFEKGGENDKNYIR